MSRLSIKARLLQWLKREQGSFTLESTIVFPMLFGLILLFILFGMYMYEKVVLYYAASATAERVAFSWDNSHREARSGMLTEPSFDGLYWRLGQDGMINSLFGLREGNKDSTVLLPLSDAVDGSKNALPVRKMENSALWMSQAGMTHDGQISYSGGVLKRTLTVKLKAPLSARNSEKSWLRREPKTVTTSVVVDPTEFIRSVDLVRYYYAKFANRTGGAGQAKTQAGQVLASYKDVANNPQP